MLFWTHKPSSICVEECKLLFRILIGQQPITLLVLEQKQGACKKLHFCFLPLILFFLIKFSFKIEYLKTNMYILFLSCFISAVNITPLSRFVHCTRLIITQRRGWGSLWGASVQVMAAFKTIYLSRHLHVKVPVFFWPKVIQQADDHMMLAESKLMTRRGSWGGQSSSVLIFRWKKGQTRLRTILS